MSAGRIPVLVVGGFLGSGKTSLLREMLDGAPDTAVIVNEFGAVGLDHELLRACEERVELVGGGCACCTRREDLVRVLRELLDARDRGAAGLSRVVIETSGLADPAPIVFTITNDPMLATTSTSERLIVTVDAVNFTDQLATHPEAAKQVLVADDSWSRRSTWSTRPSETTAVVAALRASTPRPGSAPPCTGRGEASRRGNEHARGSRSGRRRPTAARRSGSAHTADWRAQSERRRSG